jgi:hypothetical protein
VNSSTTFALAQVRHGPESRYRGARIIVKGLSGARAAVLIVVAVTGIHAVLIGLPSVNLEYAFTAATRYLAARRPEDLVLFQHYQANTFGLPLVALALYKLFPFLDLNLYPRLASIFGIPILVVAMYGLGRKLDLGEVPLACAIGLCLLNPMIWIFSGRGTADFLPAAVGMAGVYTLWTFKGTRAAALAGLILGVAIVLKYHAFVFAVVAIVRTLLEPTEPLVDRLKRALGVSLAVILIPAAYLISIKLTFGFWLTPGRFHQALEFNAVDSIANLALYATYAVMLTLPFSLVFAVKEWAFVRHGRFLIPTAVLAVSVVSGYFIGPREEMTFGPLNRMLSPSFLTSFAVMGSLLLAYIMVRIHALPNFNNASDLVRAIVYGTALFIVALSFTRPAQRYLIMILPLAYLLLFRVLSDRAVVVASLLTFPIFVGLDAYLAGYQTTTGRAAGELAMQLQSSQLLPLTDPGAVEMHAGDKFFPFRDHPKKYTVIEGRPPNAVMTVEEERFGGLIRRTYSVVPNS